MKFYLIVICLFWSCTSISGQAQSIPQKVMDSIKMVYLTEAAVRNPVLRQLVVSTEVNGNGHFRSESYGNEIVRGQFLQIRSSVLLTLPILSWKNNSITTSITYLRQDFHFSDLVYAQPDQSLGALNHSLTSYGFSAGYHRLDSLFGISTIYMGNLNIITSEMDAVRRVTFLGGMIMQAYQRANTKLSAGLLLNIDPNINFPLLPYISYWHRFKYGWEVNVNVPQQFYCRKELGRSVAVSAGSYLNGSMAFLYYQQSYLSLNYNYNILNLQDGIGVDLRLLPKLLLTLNMGIQTPLSAKIYEKNKTGSDYLVNNKLSSVPYLKLSLSVLPVIQSLFKLPVETVK